MGTTTTRTELQERQGASLALPSSAELLNAMISDEPDKGDAKSKFRSHLRSEYNSENRASMSGRVFVLGKEGKPLTPCKVGKARKLLGGGVAKPVWNKFGQFGIQMLEETRKEMPKTVLGCDFGTKFEGYSVISGTENVLNVMWKLPDKKKLVKKLEERNRLRRARRFRNCRRRPCRMDNRSKKGFIAPSQLQVMNSRLKCVSELFKCYPIGAVAIEDVKFNHRDHKWGKNFSTIEVGKRMLYDFLRVKVGVGNFIQFSGYDTQEFRERAGLKKSQDKNAKKFSAHCADSFVIANELSTAIPNQNLVYVDDNYRYVRRRLHDSQPAKGGIRAKFSSGTFKGIKKGCMCEFGQIVGGTKEQAWYCDFELQDNGRKIYQKGKMLNKINWLSHHYKSMAVIAG
ncbi:MAG: RRXRR domain-containing protein [Candidatus Woesearchaeota archaeon]